MPEEVLFKTEGLHSRDEIADYFRTVADKLDAEGELTFTFRDNSVTLNPPTIRLSR